MKRQAVLWRYVIDMASGGVLRDRLLTQRSGLIVRLTEGERCGWGEIAPLPGVSPETLSAASQACQHWLEGWCAGENPAESLLPSVAFGLSCARAELAQQLPECGEWRSAMLCHDDLAAMRINHDSRLAKIKVGRLSVSEDAARVGQVLAACPHLWLRLDANRSWTLDEAQQFAEHLSAPQRARIHFIEEPCYTRGQSYRFAAQRSMAVAWDESARDAGFRLRAAPGIAALVIKPTLTGSIARIQQQIALARKQGLRAIISSSLESSLALTQLARLAHWLTPDEIPGLDTLTLMKQQVQRRWPGCHLPLQEPEQWQYLWHH